MDNVIKERAEPSPSLNDLPSATQQAVGLHGLQLVPGSWCGHWIKWYAGRQQSAKDTAVSWQKSLGGNLRKHPTLYYIFCWTSEKWRISWLPN